MQRHGDIFHPGNSRISEPQDRVQAPVKWPCPTKIDEQVSVGLCKGV